MVNLKVNGYNFTPLMTPYGYTVSHTKIQGGNQGTMKDGSFIDDVLAYKAVIAITFMPLTQADLEWVTNALYLYDYPAVEFYDPKTKNNRRAECLFEMAPALERGKGVDGKVRWVGAGVTFTER